MSCCRVKCVIDDAEGLHASTSYFYKSSLSHHWRKGGRHEAQRSRFDYLHLLSQKYSALSSIVEFQVPAVLHWLSG